MRGIMAGVPALCGVVLGVALYVGYASWWYLAAGMTGGLAMVVTGRCVVGRYPMAAALLISLSIVLSVVAMAVASAALLWAGLHVPEMLPTLDQETLKDAAAAVTGAISTFVGVVVTKDIEDGRGPLWPSTQFKRGLLQCYGAGERAPKGDTKEWDAVHQDRVRDNGPTGWGFYARLERARILREHLRTLAS